MTEFIGSRISLISKRDIRYVGTLHEISSENSTVALENVISYGTEGRRPDEEVPANPDNVYEYIVFRGSDVKDLRIEEGPRETKKPEPPQIPDDPAILGSSRKPTGPSAPAPKPSGTPGLHSATPEQSVSGPQGLSSQVPLPSRQQPPPFQQQPFPYQFGHHPNQRFGPGGPGGPGGPSSFPPGPPGYAYPGVPYGAPPGWYPPHGFPPHMGPSPFPPSQIPGHSGQQPPIPPGPPKPASSNAAPPGFSPPTEDAKATETKPIATVKLPTSGGTPVPQVSNERGPPAVDASRPVGTSATAEFENVLPAAQPDKMASKNGRIIPVIPLSPATKKAASTNGAMRTAAAVTEGQSASAKTKSLEEANRDARAAVAAAMAKLPAGDRKQTEVPGAVDNITKFMGELRTNDTGVRGSRGSRGTRGSHRGARDQGRRIEVPKTDYDFESANAKFNKNDLVKEAIATGSPVDTPNNTLNGDKAANSITATRKASESAGTNAVSVGYNRSSSFFDDISSETKDRAENKESGQRVGGREFRNEERQKNLETFGQGSVDNNYRYGRGRGRGRGRGYGRGRGRGYDGRGGKTGAHGGGDAGQQASAAVEG